jgi:hypothetical protein
MEENPIFVVCFTMFRQTVFFVDCDGARKEKENKTEENTFLKSY